MQEATRSSNGSGISVKSMNKDENFAMIVQEGIASLLTIVPDKEELKELLRQLLKSGQIADLEKSPQRLSNANNPIYRLRPIEH